MIKKRKISAFDAIRRHYKNPRWKLTESQAAIHERWIAAYAKMKSGVSEGERIEIHMKEFGIERSAAFRDFANALNLFGDVQKAEKEGMRWVLYGFALDAYNLAKAAGNHKGMSQAVGQMTKLLGLDREDPEMPNFKDLESGHILIAVPAEIEEALRAMLGSGVMNFSKLRPPGESIPIEIPEAEVVHD